MGIEFIDPPYGYLAKKNHKLISPAAQTLAYYKQFGVLVPAINGEINLEPIKGIRTDIYGRIKTDDISQIRGGSNIPLVIFHAAVYDYTIEDTFVGRMLRGNAASTPVRRPYAHQTEPPIGVELFASRSILNHAMDKTSTVFVLAKEVDGRNVWRRRQGGFALYTRKRPKVLASVSVNLSDLNVDDRDWQDPADDPQIAEYYKANNPKLRIARISLREGKSYKEMMAA